MVGPSYPLRIYWHMPIYEICFSGTFPMSLSSSLFKFSINRQTRTATSGSAMAVDWTVCFCSESCWRILSTSGSWLVYGWWYLAPKGWERQISHQNQTLFAFVRLRRRMHNARQRLLKTPKIPHGTTHMSLWTSTMVTHSSSPGPMDMGPQSGQFYENIRTSLNILSNITIYVQLLYNYSNILPNMTEHDLTWQ